MSISNHGTTLQLNGTDIAEVISITPPSMEREAVDTHNLTSTVRTKRPSNVADPGEVEFTVQMDDSDHNVLFATATSGTIDNYVLGFPVAGVPSGVKLSFPGFISSHDFDEINRDDSDNVVANFTITLTNLATWS